MIVDGIVAPMELAHLPFKKGRTFEEYVGERALKRLGRKKWRQAVKEVVEQLSTVLEADYIVLGGGNARKLKRLPKNARLGSNDFAFIGGFRVWASRGPPPAGRPARAIGAASPFLEARRRLRRQFVKQRFKTLARGGNRFVLLSDGHDFFKRMLAAIDAGRYYVLAEFYLVESGKIADQFIDAFVRAASRGVKVRVLFDAIGARALREPDRSRLRDAGIDLVFFNIPRWRPYPSCWCGITESSWS